MRLGIRLKYPPTTNNAYTVPRGRNRLVLTKDGRDYKAGVQWALMSSDDARAYRRHLHDLADPRFHVDLTVHPPDLRRRDLMNVEKLVVDAVFKWLEVDDSAVDRITIVRGDVRRPDGHIIFDMRAIGSEDV